MSSEENNTPSEQPVPEVLHPKADTAAASPVLKTPAEVVAKVPVRSRHAFYKPSHKATFVGLGIVVVILAVNVGVIFYLMRSNNVPTNDVSKGEVTISSDVLSTLGVNRDPIGSTGTQLTINPNTNFGGNVSVSSDVNIAGQLKLNSKLSATDASFTKLEGGDTTLSGLNVNGDGSFSTLNLRKDLNVAGSTRLQGAVTVGELLTVNNNVNISGNLSIGGALSMGAFQTNTLVVGGHITTRGSAPSVSAGPAVGTGGTVSISGNDVAGTVAVNFGTGGGNGVVANVTFINAYSNIPKVTIGAIGRLSGSGYYIASRSASGFSIGVTSSVFPGGYAFDYIVMQ